MIALLVMTAEVELDEERLDQIKLEVSEDGDEMVEMRKKRNFVLEVHQIHQISIK